MASPFHATVVEVSERSFSSQIEFSPILISIICTRFSTKISDVLLKSRMVWFNLHLVHLLMESLVRPKMKLS